MFNIFIAFLCWISIFHLSGYLPRLVGITQKKASFFPTALEAVIGYAFSGLVCLGCLLLLHAAWSWCAAIIIVCSSLYATIKCYPASLGIKFLYGNSTPLAFFIKIAFILVVFIIYAPTLFGLTIYYHQPDIFDLSKNIAAVISAAHATTWPAPNPYFPTLSFAYNLFFYLPLGFICHLAQSAALASSVFAYAVIWICWQTMGLMENVFERLGLSRKFHWIGLLFITFLSGFAPALFASNAPLGYGVMAADVLTATTAWLEDPLTLFIYIPQHIFSIVCLLAAWLALNSSIRFSVSLIAQLILLVASVLSSYLLAPIVLIIFCFFVLYNFKSDSVNFQRYQFFSRAKMIGVQAVLFFLCVLPFIYQAREWAGVDEFHFCLLNQEPLSCISFRTQLDFKSLLVLSLQFGWILPLGIIGIIYLARDKVFNKINLSYLTLFFLAGCSLIFLTYPDSHIKTLVLLRFLLVPLAAIGFVWMWTSMSKRYQVFGWVLLAFPMIYGLLLSTVLFGYFIVTSYIPRDAYEISGLRALRNLPFDTQVWFLSPQQDEAAVGGHMVFMDFSGYRSDSYLPITQRNIAANFFQHFSSVPLTATAIWMPASATLYQNLDSPQKSSMNDSQALTMQNLKWISSPSPASNLAQVVWSTQTVEIKSIQLVDAFYIAPVKLVPGIYYITIKICGHVAGSAHISLLGVKKLINIPAGNYSDTELSAYFTVDNKEIVKYLAFGLGGWSTGAGDLQLETIHIEPIALKQMNVS